MGLRPALFATALTTYYRVKHNSTILTATTNHAWLVNWVNYGTFVTDTSPGGVIHVHNGTTRYLLWNSFKETLTTVNCVNAVTCLSSFDANVERCVQKIESFAKLAGRLAS